MDFFQFHLSLKVKEIGDLFDARSETGELVSRETWIRSFFSKERAFTHYKSKFVFKPEEGIVSSRRSGAMFGWIAREKRMSERTPPSEGLEPTEHVSWQALFVAIDPTDHEKGQSVAVEGNDEIGGAKAVINSLVKAMNNEVDAPYFAQVFPLLTEGSFWEFAERHGDSIKSVTFDVAAPNMFTDEDDFQNELRSLRDGENVSTVKATLDSDTALNHRTPRMEGLINYVERGAGELSAVATDGTTYSSTYSERKVPVPVERPTATTVPKFLREIVTMLDRIFP